MLSYISLRHVWSINATVRSASAFGMDLLTVSISMHGSNATSYITPLHSKGRCTNPRSPAISVTQSQLLHDIIEGMV